MGVFVVSFSKSWVSSWANRSLVGKTLATEAVLQRTQVFWYATLHDWASHSWCFKESQSLHLKSQAGRSDDGTNLFSDIRTILPEISITSLETWFLTSLVIYPVHKIQNSFVLWKLQISCRHYESHELLALLYAVLEWNGFLRPLAIWQVILTKCVFVVNSIGFFHMRMALFRDYNVLKRYNQHAL
jgi:hypothetical protein